MIEDFLNKYCIEGSISKCLQGLYNLGIAFAVVIAFIFFILGAFKNLLSTIPDIKLEGKQQMMNSLIGLAVIFLSGVILYWINPYIFSPTLKIFQVTGYQVPAVITTKTESIDINGTNYNIEVPVLKNESDIDKLTECKDKEIIRVRMTTYFTPIMEETENSHAFLSEITLQGSGIFRENNVFKKLNYKQAVNILNNLKGNYPLAQCNPPKNWHWSWIGYERGDPPKRCIQTYTHNTSREKSIREVKYDKDKAKRLIAATSTVYSPPKHLIPLRTVAYNKDEGFFLPYDVVRVLDCEGSSSCSLKNKNLIVTDRGGGEGKKYDADAWLDLYAGIGKEALKKAGSAKSDYVKVCRIGTVDKSSFR
jgi:hypothetical protein